MKKHVYNKKIIEYIKEFLEDGVEAGKTLIKAFKQTEKYMIGKYYTYIPNNLPEEHIYSFEHSIEEYYTESDWEELVNWAGEFIIGHLKSSTDAICISHGGLWSSMDPWVRTVYKEEFSLLSYNKELYFLLRNDQKGQREVANFIYESQNHWPSQIILLTYSTELNDVDEKMHELSKSQIEKLAKNTDKMLINVQDTKGYIFWENRKE